MTSVSGRDPHTGRNIEVVIRDGIIAAVTDVPSADAAWLSPGLIDLQINGYQGFDLNADNLTSDTVIELSRSVLATGVTTFLPTIITASEEKIIACLRAIAVARQLNPALQHMIPGVHVEGPHLSPEAGPRGAHPREHIRPPSIAEFDRWQRASGDLVKLVTLSPHFDEAPNYIAALRDRGILVSIGHTHASREQIHAAVDAGATLSTHLGNGVDDPLPRHPNLLWTQLAEDRLTAMFIGDGHHLPDDTLKVMLRAKGLDRAILVSDVVALGGMPSGLYETPVGGLVELTPDGRLCLHGTRFLAGSVVPLKDAVAHLASMYLSLSESLRLATQNPARFLAAQVSYRSEHLATLSASRGSRTLEFKSNPYCFKVCEEEERINASDESVSAPYSQQKVGVQVRLYGLGSQRSSTVQREIRIAGLSFRYLSLTGVHSMRRRHFLESASAATLVTILSRFRLAGASASLRQPRIAFGGIGIECSTYSRIRTRMEDFEILKGEALASSQRFAFLKKYPAQFIPTVVAQAVPGGPVERATYDAIKANFLEKLQALLPLEGLFLPMHGAMFVDGMQDAEGDWMESTRKVVGPNCLMSASYDLHGNVSQRVIDNLDMFSAFRTAPHIDKEETMERSCSMLLHCLDRHIRPTLVWAPIPVLMPGERSSTEWQPAKGLWAQLPKLNEEPGVLDVSLLVGYVWADEPRSTACAVVTGTAPVTEKKIAVDLAHQYWDARKDFRFGTETGNIDECIERAMKATTHPAILADSGDNPTGGGTGDRAEVLEELLRYKVQNTVFAGIADLPATDACYKAGVGARLPLSIGATLDPLGSRPVKATAKVIFLLPVEAPRLREAVVQIEGVTLVLSAQRRPYHDIVDFTRLGLQPSSYKIIVVKSGYLSPELAPLAHPNLMALSDGSINQDIIHLPKNRLRKPTYPFVEDLTYTPRAIVSARAPT